MAILPAITIKRKQGNITASTTAGYLERTADTLKEAKTALGYAIDVQLRMASHRTYRRADDGTMFCLHYFDGWAYDIVGTAHLDRGFPTTTSFPIEVGHAEALATMERHVAAYAGPRLRKQVSA